MTWESAGLVLGGIGLFLLGMSLMTDGLRFAAGDSLASALRRMTGNRFRGVATGAVITALVQSSSATTLMTVGLVSAGVISFANAVGIIFGANIGTTMTSWLVSLIGLKFKISAVALPLVGVGAATMVMGRGVWKFVGQGLAGFGLLFVGIEYLQLGMKDLSTIIDPTMFNPDSIGGRIVLVLVGAVMTVVMQSSSAAVASTLTALDSGAITIGAAAALVIGQNVGTTVTAMIGAIGGTTPAKRTALAHVLFNLLTGIIAFMIFPLFEHFVFDVADDLGAHDPTAQVAAFHTAFNFLGVLVLLPLIHPFSNLVERLIPSHKKAFVGNLDDATLSVPSVAIDAVESVLGSMLRASATLTLENLGSDEPGVEKLEQLLAEKAEADQYMMKIGATQLSSQGQRHHLSMMHAADHLDRLLAVVCDPTFWTQAKHFSQRFDITQALLECLGEASEWDDIKVVAKVLGEKSAEIARIRAKTRSDILLSASRGKVTNATELDDILRYVLSVDRCAYHLWRTALHLAGEEKFELDVAEP